MAKKLEELAVYQKAVEFSEAVIALLDRPAFRKDRKLHDQISDANDSITSNISEGFEQPTDRAFAHFLFIAKGSLAEVCTRLRQARLKRHITPAELSRFLAMCEGLSKMLASFIRYLARCDYKDRGRFRLGLANSDPLVNKPDPGPGPRAQGPRDPGTQGPRDPGTQGPRDLRDPGTQGPEGPRDPGT